MPKRNEKCQIQEKPKSPRTRPVIQSLDICSSRQRIQSSASSDSETCSESCSLPQCSRRASVASYPEEMFGTIQTCSQNVACEKPLLRQKNKGSKECMGSRSSSKKDLRENPLPCSTCCPAGILIKTVREALDELEELQGSCCASGTRIHAKQSGVPVSRKRSDINIPYLRTRKHDATNSPRGAPECCTRANEAQETIPRNTESCCSTESLNELAVTPCSMLNEPCCQPEPAEELNATKCTDMRSESNECTKCHEEISTTKVCENTCNTTPTQTLGKPKDASTKTSGGKLSKEQCCPTPKVVSKEKCCPSPVCGLPLDDNKKQIKCSKKKDKTTGKKTSTDVKKDPCVTCTTPEKETCVPKKCECHFPPAYNKFGCCGNISGNCNCSNRC